MAAAGPGREVLRPRPSASVRGFDGREEGWTTATSSTSGPAWLAMLKRRRIDFVSADDSPSATSGSKRPRTSAAGSGGGPTPPAGGGRTAPGPCHGEAATLALVAEPTQVAGGVGVRCQVRVLSQPPWSTQSSRGGGAAAAAAELVLMQWLMSGTWRSRRTSCLPAAAAAAAAAGEAPPAISRVLQMGGGLGLAGFVAHAVLPERPSLVVRAVGCLEPPPPPPPPLYARVAASAGGRGAQLTQTPAGRWGAVGDHRSAPLGGRATLGERSVRAAAQPGPQPPPDRAPATRGGRRWCCCCLWRRGRPRAGVVRCTGVGRPIALLAICLASVSANS
jgi:hypothetical protein